MKTISKTKIEWCDCVWNPVWGCDNKCPYCYARKFAAFRYKAIAEKEIKYRSLNYISYFNEPIEQRLKKFYPQFLYSNFNRKFLKKSLNIFVNSMSDIYYWEPTWMKKVIEKIKEYPQHNFLFLTKFPEIYLDYLFPSNALLGATFTKQSDFNLLGELDFISIEPIQEMIDLSEWKKGLSRRVEWIIVGMESGNRKEKIIPKIEWLYCILGYCRINNIPLFMKNNLQSIYHGIIIQEFPEILKNG